MGAIHRPQIRAEENRNDDENRITVSATQLAAVPLTPHKFHGDWTTRSRNPSIGEPLRHKDTKRVSVRVCVHIKRLDRILGPVQEEAGAQRQDSFVLGSQLLEAWHRQVQMQLLRHTVFGPRRTRQPGYLLKCQRRCPRRATEHQPVSATLVRLVRGRRVSRSVVVTQ